MTSAHNTCQLRADDLLRPRMRLIVHLQHMLHGQLRVALRSRKPFVPQQLLNRPQISAFLQHVRPKSMA